MGPLLQIGLSALPGIGSGIAQLFGKKRRNKEEDAAMEQIQNLSKMFQGNIEDHNSQLDKSYFDNSDVQDAITQLQEMGIFGNEQIDNQAAVMGSTDEARIAAKGANNQATARGLSRIFSGATNYRNMLFNQRGNAQRGLASVTNSQYQAGQNNRQNFNNSLQNIFGNMDQSIGGLLSSGALGGQKGISTPKMGAGIKVKG